MRAVNFILKLMRKRPLLVAGVLVKAESGRLRAMGAALRADWWIGATRVTRKRRIGRDRGGELVCDFFANLVMGGEDIGGNL